MAYVDSGAVMHAEFNYDSEASLKCDIPSQNTMFLL